jgi:hypothetical protein
MENNLNKKLYYIVYCTTNIQNKKIYVGVHSTYDPNKFDGYIGCGVYMQRAYTYQHSKTKFQNAVKKYGPKSFTRLTLKIYNNEEDAYLLESEIVNEEFLSRNDVYNMMLGGKGGDRGMAKEVFQYDKSGNFINMYNSIYEASINVDRGLTSVSRAIHDKISCADYFWSFDKYDKLNLFEYKTENNKVPIFQYSSDGQYDCYYESINDAARVNNSVSTNVHRAAKLGYLLNDKYFLYNFHSEFSIAKTETIKGREVHQYSEEGSYIQSFKNEAEAIRFLNIKKVSIANAIRLNRLAGGFQWRLEKLDKISPVEKKSPKATKVGKYTKDEKLIKIYDTVTKCVEENGTGIKHVLQGRNEFSKGYKYKYIN